jgi:hypothetical protein
VAELNAGDLEMFGRFRIGADLVASAQIQRVTSTEARRDGFSLAAHAAADLSGIVFPYLHPLNGHAATSRLRRDRPDTIRRARSRTSVSRHTGITATYFPPGSQALLADTSVSVVIVETEKSALALAALAERCSWRLLVIATGGCWGWKGKTGFEGGTSASAYHPDRGGDLRIMQQLNGLIEVVRKQLC